MKTFFWRIAPLGTMLIFPVMGLLYALVDGPHGQVFDLTTKLDRMIPFVKEFVVPYSIWIFYIYICVVYFYFKDPAVYARSLATYVVCALICYAIYMTFQTTVARPVVVGDDVFSRLLRYVYHRDRPFNCFPSIHCFSSYLVMKALYKSNFKTKWNQILIYGMSSTIICSTLFVKQHVIFDLIAAIVLVEVVYFAVSRLQSASPVFNREKAL